MTNPCRRHFQRVTAAVAAASAGPDQSMAGANAYELHMAQLLQDQIRLKQIMSTEAKIALKHQLVPAYSAYIDGVLSAGQGAQDDVLVTVMLWRVDIADFAGALDIAEYVLANKLKMPDRFNRTPACVVAEEIAENANKALKAGTCFDLELLHRTAAVTADHDMPDEARAKLHLAIARATVAGISEDYPGQPGQLQAAIAQFQRALELHERCGAKKEMEAAERLLKKLTGNAG